ncbi:Por secretion system C-terminal sorting domain-containing protein, partial [Reichenbachiella agariperforans]
FPITASTTVTWTFSDDSGNLTTQTQEVVISDTTAPVADATTLTTVNGECSITAADLTVPTATDNCSGAINATTDVTFPITASTTVTWTFTDESGNSHTQTQEVVVTECNTLAVTDETIELVVYPNPVTTSFSISEKNIRELTVLDVSGHILKYFTTSQNKYDISELPQGVYIIEIQTSNDRLVRRLIKQ